MNIGNKKNMAGHTRERKSIPQYEGTLCTKYFSCQKDGHCRPRCSNNSTMKCYKSPKEMSLSKK